MYVYLYKAEYKLVMNDGLKMLSLNHISHKLQVNFRTYLDIQLNRKIIETI